MMERRREAWEWRGVGGGGRGWCSDRQGIGNGELKGQRKADRKRNQTKREG